MPVEDAADVLHRLPDGERLHQQRPTIAARQGAWRRSLDEEGAALQSALRGLPTFARELIAGGVAGGLGKTCVAPLERVKILFQTGQLRDRSVWGTLVEIGRTEGVGGLFRGNGASLLRIVPYAALHFAAYEHYRAALVAALLEQRGGGPEAAVPPLVDLIAGAGAGGTAVAATYPLDLVRTRLAYRSESSAPEPSSSLRSQPHASVPPGPPAPGGLLTPQGPQPQPQPRAPLLHSPGLPASPQGAPSPPPPRGAPAAAATITGVLRGTWRAEGLRGLYSGAGPTLVGIVPYAGLKFYCYQSLKGLYRRFDTRPGPPRGSPRAKAPVAVSLSCGALSGLVAQTLTYPLDVVRRQMQVQGLALRAQHPQQEPLVLRSTWSGLVLLARTRGWQGLFAGLSINYMKVVPSTAIGFTAYDAVKQYLDLPGSL